MKGLNTRKKNGVGLILFSVLFYAKHFCSDPPNLLNLEKIGKEKLLAKILGKTRNALVEETNNHTIQNILKITMRSSIPRVSKL